MSAPLSFEANVKLNNLRVMTSRMDILRLAYPKAAQAAVYTLATDVTDQIYNNAPEDTGFLKQSAYVAPTKGSAKFGFGAWYARIVNGRDNVKFKTGRKRFMSSTLDEVFPTILPRLAVLMEQYIKAGTTIDNVQRRYPPVPIAGDGYRKRRKRAASGTRIILSRAAGGFTFARAPRKRKKKKAKK